MFLEKYITLVLLGTTILERKVLLIILVNPLKKIYDSESTLLAKPSFNIPLGQNILHERLTIFYRRTFHFKLFHNL